MKIRTKKMADGTYAWKLDLADGFTKNPWERTQARTPWGARVQGMPYLVAERKAAEKFAASGWTGYVPNDFAAPYAA